MFKKISLFLAMIVFSSLFFVSCEEDTLTSGDAEITSLSDSIALPGQRVTINGSNFGASKLATYKVMVGATEVLDSNTVSWTDSKIVIQVPGTITPSNTATYIQVIAATSSNKVTFYVNNKNAEITSLSNVIALPGGEVTINGSNFGSSQLSSYKVMVGTTDVSVSNTVSWSDSKIVIKVPGSILPSNTATFIQVFAATTSNKATFYVGNPNPIAPTAIKATSITDSIVHLTWTPSEDEGKAIFAGYELILSEQGGAPLAPINIAKNATPYEIKGLTQGTVYTFEIRGKFNAEAKNAVSTAAATISWSPASRFNETSNEVPIRVYGTRSQFGSGLRLFDETEGAPNIFKIASSPDWQLCLYTTDGALEFGSAAAQSKYTYNSGTPQETQIADVDIFADNLNDSFLGAALNSFSFSNKVINLNDAKYAAQAKGVVFVVRVKNTDDTYNYAKVLVKKVANKFLQGTGDDSYLECVVSYQKVKGIPYARF